MTARCHTGACSNDGTERGPYGVLCDACAMRIGKLVERMTGRFPAVLVTR